MWMVLEEPVEEGLADLIIPLKRFSYGVCMVKYLDPTLHFSQQENENQEAGPTLPRGPPPTPLTGLFLAGNPTKPRRA